MPFNKLSHEQSQSRLFTLPPELRELIYRSILTKGVPISPQRRSHCAEERAIIPLFQACRRIHQETTKLYFGTNTFRFHDDGELADVELPLFFRALPAEMLPLCTNISLESSLGPQCNIRCQSPYCVGSIEIDLSTSTVSTTGRTNCCGQRADLLDRAREEVQAPLSGVRIAAMDPSQRARLGGEVGTRFCATFEHLHPDYGD